MTADAKPEVSGAVLQRWQNLVNVQAELLRVPAGLIMRVRASQIEVLISSESEGNPYHAGDGEHLGGGLYCETVMAKRSELLVPNALRDPEWAENPDVRLDMISYLGLPLAWPDGEVFGTICVLDNKENGYSDLYRKLMGSFRDQIDADLRLLTQVQEVRFSKEKLERLNADLEDKVRERTAELTHANQQLADETEELRSLHETLRSSARGARLIKDVAVAANEATTRDEALQVALDRICEYTHWPVGHAYERMPDGVLELAPTGLWHFDEPSRFQVFREVTERTIFASGIGLPGRVLSSGAPAWIRDVQEDTNFPRNQLARKLGVHAGFAFPVVTDGQIEIVLEFFCERVEPPDEALLSILDQVGIQLGVVVQRKRAEDEIRHSERRAHVTKDVAMAANEAEDVDGVYRVALEGVCSVTHWPVGHVYTLVDGELRPTDTWCFDSTGPKTLAIDVGLPGRVLADGKPHWVEDVTRDPDSPRSHSGLDGGVRGAFAFPVLVEGKVVAVLEFYSSRVERPDDPLLVFMDQIGMQIGAAIQRIRAAREKSVLERNLYKGQKLQALGTLSSGIAHDFNNILQAIYGFLDLAGENHPAFDVPRCLDGVRSAAARAHDLVHQILGFSRPSSTGLELVDMRRAVEETVTLLRASIPSTIDVAMQVEDDCGRVLADAGKIHQVIMNLGVNAFRSIEGETGRIDITAARIRLVEEHEGVAGVIPPGDYVFLTVEDTGCGMDSDTLENIFDPFFTTRDVGEGTGLGLALVYGVMRSLRGGIEVESEVGLGTSFKIYLPEAAAAAAEAAPAGQQKSPEVLAGARVLFVDDEEILVHLGETRLRSLGCAVEGVQGSREALELFLSDPSAFDLVILDQNMPEMTGMTLAGRIHAVRSDLPMILSSGLGATLAKTDLEGTGIRSILCKPHSGQELADAVAKALRQAGSP